ncbi:hypothetical protein ACF061_15965 [Streptomyces sp. NPDC015220]|uniref:hypothetical protein n=1 Tax=Streptomyces sp. NPDC015220 TaxID=3364947 RepID=UPI003700CCEF
MQITASTVSLTVGDLTAPERFFTTHPGYAEQAAADAFASPARQFVEAGHPGHRMTGWAGAVPDDLADALAMAMNAMNDMPIEDRHHGYAAWDAHRVPAMAKVIADRGHTLPAIAAVHQDGTMAGTGVGRPDPDPAAEHRPPVSRHGPSRTALRRRLFRSRR